MGEWEKSFQDTVFKRRVCTKCNSYFWKDITSSVLKEDNCKESPCFPYSYFEPQYEEYISPEKNITISSIRNSFLSFFNQNEHNIVPPCSTISTWKDDVFFTQASIYQFQPDVTSGKKAPPFNPLVVSQPCIRLNDLDIVGFSPRHLTLFTMLGHHSFNSKDGIIYGQEKMVQYCLEFFKSIKISSKIITFKESVWEGGGNSGPCLEVICL